MGLIRLTRIHDNEPILCSTERIACFGTITGEEGTVLHMAGSHSQGVREAIDDVEDCFNRAIQPGFAGTTQTSSTPLGPWTAPPSPEERLAILKKEAAEVAAAEAVTAAEAAVANQSVGVDGTEATGAAKGPRPIEA